MHLQHARYRNTTLTAIALITAAADARPPIWEEDIGPELTALDNADESERTRVDLPFTFTYQGMTYDSMWVYVGGIITLGTEQALPSAPDPDDLEDLDQPAIAPFWTDLQTEDGGSIHYNTWPDRVVVTWNEVRSDEQDDDDGWDYDFQVQLFDDGVIVLALDDDLFISEGSLNADVITGISDGDVGNDSELVLGSSLPSSVTSGTVYQFWPEEEIIYTLRNRNVIFIPRQGSGFDVLSDLTAYEPAFVQGAPIHLNADGETIEIAFQAATSRLIDPDSGVLHLSYGDTETAIPLSPVGDDTYAAQTPLIACGTLVRYWYEFRTRFGDTIRRPLSGEENPRVAIVSDTRPPIAFEDHFETDQGWATTLDAPQGVGGWERGVPVIDPRISHPDADADGSGQGFFAPLDPDNTPSPLTVSTLTSPAIVADMLDPWITYSVWFGLSSVSDFIDFEDNAMTIELSTNGGASWTQIERFEADHDYGMSGGWMHRAHQLGEPITTNDAVRLRLTVDTGNPTTAMHSGLDEVYLVDLDPSFSVCAGGPCEADVAEPYGTLNFFDVATYLNAFENADPAADLAAPFGTLNFFDVSAYIDLYNAGCP